MCAITLGSQGMVSQFYEECDIEQSHIYEECDGIELAVLMVSHIYEECDGIDDGHY